MHFLSSADVGLHNVIGQDVATRHAAGLRGRKVYAPEGVAVHRTRV